MPTSRPDPVASDAGQGDAENGAERVAKAATNEQPEASPEVPPQEAERRDMLLQCRTKDEAFDLIKDVGAGTYGLVSKCDSSQFHRPELRLSICCLSPCTACA